MAAGHFPGLRFGRLLCTGGSRHCATTLVALRDKAKLSQHIRDLEDRLSELLGQQAFERSGLGAPTGTAALQAELEQHRQANLDLKRVLEERDEELAAARETNRRLMNQLNRPVS
jgi:hypothetical protein